MIYRPALATRGGKGKMRDTPVALFGPPEAWVATLTTRFEHLDAVTTGDILANAAAPAARARRAYTDLLQSLLVGTAFQKSEHSVLPTLGQTRSVVVAFDAARREQGEDHAYLGYTMIGHTRMRSLAELLDRVVAAGIPGDVVETGVWRGGASIFMHGILRAYGGAESHRRTVYVCDSFAGIPPGDKRLHPQDTGWDKFPYLSVDADEVAANFAAFSLLDTSVVFVQGFFNATMPRLAPLLASGSIAVLRMDGDIYESTVDVLYHLYDRVALHGFVIVDDWFGFPARAACEDFFEVHGINPTIVAVDRLSVYWEKTEHVAVQYWRYQQQIFKKKSKRT